VNDNGAGLRAFFYGMCAFHEIDVRDPEDFGEAAADFYLAAPALSRFVLILPEPNDRPVEIAALRDHQVRFLLLDREDLDHLRTAGTRSAAVRQITYWIEYQTHCDVMRRNAGIA
jgi:hypothetical protein